LRRELIDEIRQMLSRSSQFIPVWRVSAVDRVADECMREVFARGSAD